MWLSILCSDKYKYYGAYLMAAGDKILATVYNNIRTKVNSVLGEGTGSFGYGQSLYSVNAKGPSAGPTGNDHIEADAWDLLRYDIIRAYKHQNGLAPTISDINADVKIQWYLAVQYDLLANTLVAYKDLAFIGGTSGPYTKQLDVINGGSQDLDAGWGVNSAGQQHQQQQYFITFNDSNHARYFFNAGGYLRITMSHQNVVGSPNTKTVGWNGVVSNMNSQYFTFDKDKYRVGLLGGQTKWEYLRHDSTNPYTENYGYMRFRMVDARTIEVYIELVDADVGDHELWNENNVQDVGDPLYYGQAVDEPVQSIITAGLEYRQPIDQVTLPTPSFTVGPWTTQYSPTGRSFTTPGAHSWTVPDGISSVLVVIVGGGGGGAGGSSVITSDENGSSTTYIGGGGGGGGEIIQANYVVTPGQTLSINVGSGGSAGAAGANGGDAGNTTMSGGVSGVISARGGKGGLINIGGAGGGGSAGALNGGGGGTSAAVGLAGGAGLTVSLVDKSYELGGGGGGGNPSGAGGPASQGGGKGGTSNVVVAQAGLNGSGGGGGGGGTQLYPGAGGGSGRVTIYG